MLGPWKETVIQLYYELDAEIDQMQLRSVNLFQKGFLTETDKIIQLKSKNVSNIRSRFSKLVC